MMDELIKKYTNLGVNRDKIHTSVLPSVTCWSISRKCIVGEGVSMLEIINDGGGNLKASYENNRKVFMLIRTELTKDDINEINNSDGIICTDKLYGADGFRYGFIPSE